MPVNMASVSMPASAQASMFWERQSMAVRDLGSIRNRKRRPELQRIDAQAGLSYCRYLLLENFGVEPVRLRIAGHGASAQDKHSARRDPGNT